MTSRSTQLFARAQKRIPGGVNSPVRAFRAVGRDPFFVDRAEGAHIWDVDGNEYIDYVGTWGPAILGHAPRVVVDAVREAAGRGVSFGIPNPLEVEMAELICQWVPSIEKVRMVNSGTEATMSCIRLARGFTGRDKIIKFEGCYHGHVDSLLVNAGSGALTHGQPDSAGVPQRICRADDLAAVQRYRSCARAHFVTTRRKSPRSFSNRFRPTPASIFRAKISSRRCARNAREHGALLIFDEVMTGFRVARGGAQEIYGIVPDLTALGKVIGGGLPVGAFGGRAEIMDKLSPLGPVYQAGTLIGKSARHGCRSCAIARTRANRRLVTARKTRRGNGSRRARKPARSENRSATFHRIGSMFCLFFTAGPVFDLATRSEATQKSSPDSSMPVSTRGVIFAPRNSRPDFFPPRINHPTSRNGCE